MRTDRTKLKQSLLNLLSNGSKFTENGRVTLGGGAFRSRPADGALRRLRYRHRHDRGAARPAVPGVHRRPMRRRPGSTAAPASASRSPGSSASCSAATSRSPASPAKARPSPSPCRRTAEAPAPVKPAAAPPHCRRMPTWRRLSSSSTTIRRPRELLSASLKSAGYRLVHAASGDEALALARTVRPDAITLDVMMPKPDGWEVLSALKADADLLRYPGGHRHHGCPIAASACRSAPSMC